VDSASFPGVSSFSASLVDASHLLLPSIVADTIVLSVEDASRLNIGAVASDTTLRAKGASTVQMSGSSYNLTLIADDASVASCKEFVVAETGSATLSGASEAWIHVNGTILIDVTDASSLYYRGSPTIGSLTIDGASSVIEF
jgi:hypothetical protein